MTVTTTQNMALTKRALAILATLAFAFCLALAIGAAPAYAACENPSTTSENASGTTVDPNQEQPTSTDPAAGAVAPASAEESPAPTAPATSSNAGDELVASGDLEAASGHTRPVDDNSTDLFIGLVPVSTDSYDVNAVSASSNSETNAIYVDLEAEVGTGVNLAVAVDYMRVFRSVYDAQAGSTRLVELPSGSSDTVTSSFPKNGLMYTWYRNGIAPLGQGTYYTDPDTNPALYATGAGSISESSVFSRYDEKFENFFRENTAIHGNTWTDRYVSSVPFPTHEGDESPFEGFTLPLEDEIGAHQSSMYMTSPLFFETAGERIIAVQFTCVEEFRSTITGTENVGYVIYASNPVYFRITIKEKPVVTLNVSAVDATTGASIDISGTNFEVELDKDYFNGYKSLGGDEDYGDLSFSALINRRVSQTSYPYMASGLYRLKVRHAEGLYSEYEEYFEVTEAQASSGAAITKVVRLQAVTPQKYTITFYDEDGTSVLMSGRQYNAGTVASSIQAPDTPTKASTDKYMYVFKGWRAEVVGEGELDNSAIVYAHMYPVTCDTNYIAEYREILIKNDAGQSIVYATGNLFSEDAKPAGVLAYGLTSSSLTETEKSGVIESHSGMMAASSVLGMVRVDLTQYNDDKKKTTTNVTEHEGLEGMKLKFNMEESGIAVSEGDKLKILQIHKKDESSAEEIIEHKATVTNGEVEITLNGKLSTFVFMRDLDAQGGGDTGSGDSGGGTSGDDPTGGTNDTTDIEPTTPPAGDDPTDDPAENDTPGASTPPEPSNENNEPASSAELADAVTRPVPAADDFKIGEGGLNDDGRGDEEPEPAKAAPAVDDGKTMPQTGDPLSPMALAIVIAAAFVLAVRVRARITTRGQSSSGYKVLPGGTEKALWKDDACMTATTPKGMAPTNWALAILATITLAFCLALVLGASPAYADGESAPEAEENQSATSENAAVTPGVPAPMTQPVQLAVADPADDTAAPSAAVSAPAAAEDTPAAVPAPGASSPVTVEGAPTSTVPVASPNEGVEPAPSNDLEAAGGTVYAASNDPTDVSISITPYLSDTYLQSEVGRGVYLTVAIANIRIGETAYTDLVNSYGTTIALPNGNAGSYTVSSPPQGFMFSWYINEPPFRQGTYYSTPDTNPALTGGGASGGFFDMVPAGVNLDDYKAERTSMMTANPAYYHGRFYADVPYMYSSTTGLSGTSGSVSLEAPVYRQISASDSGRYTLSPLFFEQPGTYTIFAQLTYMQECRAVSGSAEQVGYVLHASNPVAFTISVASKPTTNLIIAAQDRSGASIDISTGDYLVELQKCYIDTSWMSSINYENLAYSYCDNFNEPCTYAYATAGYYKLTVTHKTGLYRKCVEYFEITDDDIMAASESIDNAVNKMVLLRPGSLEKFTITFYDDDGKTVLLAGAEYTEGTIAENIVAPSTPTKASTDKYKYVFDKWRAEVVGIGELDTTGVIVNHLYPVSCSVNYIAEYRSIPIKNDAGQSIVYATGDLFSNDPPEGVLAYGLTSKPLTEAEKSGVIAGHSGMMPADKVLGMVQVDLTQYNDDEGNTTTNITEHDGLKGMKLEFDMGELGIDAEEGANLKVLQIHKKDENSPEKIIEHKATVEGGKVNLTLDGNLSTFVFMMADPYPGDDGTQENFLGLVPTNDFEFEIDENNTIHVYLESNVGKSLDLDVNLNYFRIGEIVYDARESDKYVPIGNDMHKQDGAMICWYVGDAPLPQGAFSTSVDQRLLESDAPVIDGGSGTGGLSDSTGLVQYDVTAFNYLFSFIGDPENWWKYEIPNRICAYVMNTQTTHGEPGDLDVEYAFFLDSDKKGEYILSARNKPEYLLFTKAGTYTFTAQASYAVDTVTDILDPVTGEPFVDELGNTYQCVDYTFYMSFPVVFHITVGEAPAAKLLLSATDGVDEVALDSSFKIELYKQLEDETYALCSTTNSYEGATAGAYKLKVTSKYGTYEAKEIEFSLTIGEIEEAGEADSTITKTIELVAIPDPPQFTIVFTNYDDSVLSTTQYNENTLSEAVVVPVDPTKPEDGDFTYKFEGWETEQDGEMVRTNISNVTSDKVYRAVYRAMSKDVVSNSTIRVYATGGLFGQPRPEGVEKHELVVSEPSESEKTSIIRTYGGTIGGRTVDGVYVVDIIQHRTDGDSVSLTEGVGDVVLTFPTTLANGTLANVYQLHKLSNGGTVVIEHNNLLVVGGGIEVPLDGRLSTFIVTSAAEVEAADPDNGGQNGNTNNGSSGMSSEESSKTTTPDSEVGNGSDGAQAADDPAEAEAPLTEPVKAAPAASDGALPATGDPLSPVALVLAALALLAAVTALTTRNRRKTQL